MDNEDEETSEGTDPYKWSRPMQPWQSRELASTVSEFRLLGEKYFQEGLLDASFRTRWEKCADLGLLSFSAAGGPGSDLSTMMAAYEGFGQGSTDFSALFALAAHLLSVQMTIENWGGDAVKDAYLGKMADGRLIAAHAVTEEVAGSDVFAMETTAVSKGSYYRLKGRKTYITAAGEADLALVFARTAQQAGPFSLSAFVVDLTEPGVTRGRQFKKLGLQEVDMGELVFDDVQLPVNHRIGTEGAGFGILSESTTWERALLPVTLLGAMRSSIEECVNWSRKRLQFGQPIADFQQVSSKIADMTSRYQVSRQLLYDIAAHLGAEGSGRRLAEKAAIVKLVASENAVLIQRDAVQIMGVRGYLADSLVARNLCDALGSTLWSGTSETLRNTIARLVGLPDEKARLEIGAERIRPASSALRKS